MQKRRLAQKLSANRKLALRLVKRESSRLLALIAKPPLDVAVTDRSEAGEAGANRGRVGENSRGRVRGGLRPKQGHRPRCARGPFLRGT